MTPRNQPVRPILLVYDIKEAKGMLNIATEEEIKAGKVTDVYFLRCREVLERLGIRRRVVVEVVAKKLPSEYEWAVLAGIQEVVDLVEGLEVTLKAAPEGTVFAPNQPVVVIEGDYLDFGTYETSILGLLCQASGVATKAARCRLAAGDTPLFSFGSRRIHPAVAPMMERSAFIGGCDGVAAVKSAELLGVKPVGTMPHALVLLVGDTVGAARAFDEWIPPDIKRVALIDTFQDEKFEALRVAEALGDRLYALRLDTPMSRRGDMLEILREVRWELDLRGHQDIRLMVSGGVDEGEIRDLNGVVDAYGVGTSISNAPVIDFSMDIVEIEGEPVSKRGKASGAKEVFRCIECDRTIVRPAGISTAGEVCDCGGEFRPVLKEMVRAGKVVERPEPAPVIRDRVIRQLEKAAWRL